MTLALHDAVALIEQEAAALAVAVSAGDLAAAVPSCPDWSLRELMEHHGNVLRAWAANVEAAGVQPTWMTDPQGRPPWDEPGEDWQPWYEQGVAALVGALATAGADSPCWTWWGEPRTAGAVARHQVQEACVHRWDAEHAVGLALPLPAVAALDGVPEFLAVNLGTSVRALPPPGRPRLVVRLVASDGPASWLVHLDAEGVRVEASGTAPAADGTPEVRGVASDLVLLLYRRIPLGALGHTGDAEVMQTFLSHCGDK